MESGQTGLQFASIAAVQTIFLKWHIYKRKPITCQKIKSKVGPRRLIRLDWTSTQWPNPSSPSPKHSHCCLALDSSHIFKSIRTKSHLQNVITLSKGICWMTSLYMQLSFWSTLAFTQMRPGTNWFHQQQLHFVMTSKTLTFLRGSCFSPLEKVTTFLATFSFNCYYIDLDFIEHGSVSKAHCIQAFRRLMSWCSG